MTTNQIDQMKRRILRDYIAKRAAWVMVLFLVSIGSVMAQTASNGNQKISKSERGYKIEMIVSPKKATALLVDTIKSRQTTVIKAGSTEITVEYTGTGYIVEGVEHKRIADARKAVRGLIRTALGIN